MPTPASVAGTDAFHERRHDGLHTPNSPADRAAFLATCHSFPPDMQECQDPAHLAQHMDECERIRERTVRDTQAAQRARAAASDEPVDRDELESFDTDEPSAPSEPESD
jgi:hypothetical protein